MSQMNNESDRQLLPAVVDFKASVKNFYEQSKKTKFLSCKAGADPAKPSDLVRSNFVNSITDIIQNTDTFKKKYEDLTEYGDSLGNLAASVVAYKTKDPKTLKSAFKTKLTEIIGLMVTKLTSIQESIKKVDSYMNELIDYKKTRFNMILGFVSAVISIAGVILFYWLFMIFTMKLKKCMFLNTLCRLIMITKVCLGILISIISIALILVTLVVFNTCWIYDKSFQDQNFADQMLAKAKGSNLEFVQYAQNCIYKEKGNFRDFLTEEQKKGYDETVGKFDMLYKLSESNLKTYNG
jgi:hypothetical protein